jgi:hypothetical protein
VLSGVERDGDTATLRFADRVDGAWSPAQTVASGADWFVNWADVPSVIPLQHESAPRCEPRSGRSSRLGIHVAGE